MSVPVLQSQRVSIVIKDKVVVKAGLNAGALKVKERCAQIIEKTNEGLANLDMMNIKRN